MDESIKFNLMPSAKDLKIFILDRIKHVNTHTKIRFIKYNKTGAIYELSSGTLDKMQFCPSFANVQSVDFINKKVVYTIRNNTAGYYSIISEIDYFRRNRK